MRQSGTGTASARFRSCTFVILVGYFTHWTLKTIENIMKNRQEKRWVLIRWIKYTRY